jgi:hypothetical protein
MSIAGKQHRAECRVRFADRSPALKCVPRPLILFQNTPAGWPRLFHVTANWFRCRPRPDRTLTLTSFKVSPQDRVCPRAPSSNRDIDSAGWKPREYGNIGTMRIRCLMAWWPTLLVMRNGCRYPPRSPIRVCPGHRMFRPFRRTFARVTWPFEQIFLLQTRGSPRTIYSASRVSIRRDKFVKSRLRI